MTQFSQIELLYNEYEHLSDEISKMLKDESYEDVKEKLAEREKLMNEIIAVKKTVELTKEDEVKLYEIESKIHKENIATIEALEVLKNEVGLELNKTIQRVRVNSAYTIHSEPDGGDLLDYSE
jgi:hypothetical protein